MTHRRHIALTLVALVLAGATARLTGTAGQPTTLTGTTLRPIQDADAVIGDLLSMFGGGGTREPRPSIERVAVVEDGARRLVLAVTYSGLANLSLAGETRGRDRRRQPFIVAEPVSLASAAGDATLAFQLQDGVPEGTRIESASLRLVAFDPARPSVPVFSRAFALSKQWNSTPAASNAVVTATPRPIGTAAHLGSRPDYAQPPKIAVPIRGVAVDGRPATTVVRDHRDGGATVTRPGGGTVRVHRDGQSGQVRDHRDGQSGQVRDHRDGGTTTTARPSSGTTRDHRTRRQVTERTRPAVDQLPRNVKTVRIEDFPIGINRDDAQKGAQGPAAAAVELLEGLRTDDINLDPASLLSIASSIYPDKNAASGIFYYHPRSYHLEWTAESGYGMRILYGAANGEGAAGEVLMAARLNSGLDHSEVQLAHDLLTAYVRRNPSVAFKTLRPLPLEKDGADISFSAVLGQYSIPKEKIAITALSDVLGDIEVSWITDPVTKENLQLALVEDVGVSGQVSFTSVGNALAPQVPISIQLADRDSFGRLRWNRSEGPRNLTPYPLRLRYLHALCIDPRTNLPILYSWSLDEVEVPPMARVRWDAARVPSWIDTEAKRVWVDYGVSQNCDTCDRDVLDAITGGVTSVTAEQITFHTITPLADVGGYEIAVSVRSKFFDPKDRTVLEKTVVLKADNQDFTLRPIYSGNRREGEPLFEYRLDVTLPDGSVLRGDRWLRGESLRVTVGRFQLEQSIGTLPAKPEER